MTTKPDETAESLTTLRPMLDAIVKRSEKKGVYGEWCRDPNLCADKGYCPRDPTCAD